MTDDDYRSLRAICWEIEQNLLQQAHSILNREQATLDAMPVGSAEMKLRDRCDTMRLALDFIEHGVEVLNTVANEGPSRGRRHH
jgi:hypothetical protein